MQIRSHCNVPTVLSESDVVNVPVISKGRLRRDYPAAVVAVSLEALSATRSLHGFVNVQIDFVQSVVPQSARVGLTR